MPSPTPPTLSRPQIEHFIADGFVRIDEAFPAALADEVRTLLWRDLPGCEPHDPATWTRPVVRLGMYSGEPFRRAADGARLRGALDQLVGAGRWAPCASMGTFPVRFPSDEDAGDTGWHIDPGFDFHKPDFLDWRANLASRGRALLMLFLFSDVGEEDAPTRLRVGSHLDTARILAPAGEQGLTLRELAADDFAASAHRPVVHATGPAGTVYLCHPFLVHAAQAHRGQRPRFMAQPALRLREGVAFGLAGSEAFPVEQAGFGLGR